MTTAWSHLPNARHIDRVLAHVQANPEKWDVGWHAARRVAWYGAWDVARAGARGQAWHAAIDASRIAVSDSAKAAARDAMLALIAYDDSARYLEYTPEELRVWSALSEDSGAMLLLPAVIAMA
tara:strand:- start:391 stop:759 length:369 start_codon:yes stop_codon:yes gene_type:complete